MSIHITSAGCYFEDDLLELVQLDLQPLLEETNSYLLKILVDHIGHQLTGGGAGGHYGRCW